MQPQSSDINDREQKIIRELVRRKELAKYQFYVPNGKSERFIRMVGNHQHFINLLIAANGLGKTAVLCNIIANICFSINQSWFNYPLYTKFPFIPKGRIISDSTTVTKTIVPELKKWFPANQYIASKGDKHFDSIWKTQGVDKPAFEFDIMTYEQDVKQFESATLGFAILDEPVPEVIWKATISRMRRGGIIICCFTPLEGSAFFYDNYVTSPDVVHYQ